MTAAEVQVTYGPTIQSVASVVGVPAVVPTMSDYVNLVSSIITQESGGNPNAVGDSGCSLGLMQLNTCAGWLPSFGYSGENLFDPQTNILYGCQYLNAQLNQYGNIDQAVSAYNAGTATSANSNYVNAVIGYLNQLGGFIQKNPVVTIAGAVLVILGIVALARGQRK